MADPTGRNHRIMSAVSDTWGHGIIYDPDEEAMESKRSLVSKVSQKLSTYSKEVENVEISVSESSSEPIAATAAVELPVILSACYATVLEDVLSQVWILENCNINLNMTKTMSDIHNLKAIKYSVFKNEVKDELDGIKFHDFNNMIYKIRKLDTDRKFLYNIMKETYLSLARSNSFEPLTKCINSILELDEYRLQLADEESKNKLVRKELSRQVRQQHNHIKTVLYDTDVTIDKLRTKVEDSVLYSEVRSRYVDNWQRARTEQHHQNIYDTEHAPASAIEYYKRRSEYEERIHMEVDSLVTIAINEILQRIEEWMDKYDKDMDAIDLDIQKKKNEYQNMRDRRVNLEKTLEKHKVQMQQWNDFKEEREKIRAYRAKMIESAIIVQAWWRGLLVRLELGPFRPRKHRHAKKK